MSVRPFRHLCPEADERDAVTDDEFWQRVADNLTPPHWDEDDAGDDLDVAIKTVPCVECGEFGACAYDSEGRPLIHAQTDQDNTT